MSIDQKMAWLMVGAAATGLILFAVLIPFIGIKPAFAAFGVIGFSGLGPLIFRKKRKAAVVAVDERGKTIGRKAALAGAIISYEVFILASMATWFIYRFGKGKELISVDALPCIVGGGWLAFMVSWSVALLILYGRESRHGEE